MQTRRQLPKATKIGFQPLGLPYCPQIINVVTLLRLISKDYNTNSLSSIKKVENNMSMFYKAVSKSSAPTTEHTTHLQSLLA